MRSWLESLGDDMTSSTDAGAGRVRWGGEMSQISKKKTRWGRPRWYQTPHQKASPLCPEKRKIIDMRHFTCHTSHMTWDMWHVVRKNIFSFQHTVWDLWYFSFLRFRGKGLFTHCTDVLNDWNNDKPLCKTALATQGMLNINILPILDYMIGHLKEPFFATKKQAPAKLEDDTTP